MKLEEALQQIKPFDEQAKRQCLARWDSIAKPLRSLGKIETGIAQIAGITGTHQVTMDKKALVIMCADNGVVAEGITQTGNEVTALVAENFLSHNACVCIMAEKAGVDIYPIDVGIARDTKVPSKKVAYGTKNMRYEPAMTREQAVRIIEVGIETVLMLKEKGYHIIATGEMGIGNTTTSSAIASVILDMPVELLTGKGAGLSQQGLERKIQVIKESIALHKPSKENPIEVLSAIGGYDIAGLVGLYIGSAVAGMPIVMDGFISSVAALIATKIKSEVRGFMLASHVSKEPAGGIILEALSATPYLTCDMCLGEGTGAVALFPLLDMGLSVYERMSTFEQVDMEAYQQL